MSSAHVEVEKSIKNAVVNEGFAVQNDYFLLTYLPALLQPVVDFLCTRKRPKGFKKLEIEGCRSV